MVGKNEAAGTKRGYLNSDFEFFHLKDRRSLEFDFHYHDFSKIIILLSGKVTYYIEGTGYKLQPWDILLVSNKEIHRPVIEQGELYERIVIWINPNFLQEHSSPECDLMKCFDLVSSSPFISNVLRPDAESLIKARSLLLQLEEAVKSREYGSRLLGNSLFVQFLILINRGIINRANKNPSVPTEYDITINAVIKYISENLSSDLSIEKLSEKFFMSRYHLMHKFKACTGYSIHSFILQKRLIMSNELIKKGKSATEASLDCGFNDYSSFIRAFKKMFGYSPRQHMKNLFTQN